MEYAKNLFGAYITDLINIKQFKEKNSYLVPKLRLSKIKERTIIAKLQSINPNIDLSNIVDKMKCNEIKSKKDVYRNVFTSSDILNARYILPIYNTVISDLQVLDPAKSDLCQFKRARVYTPLPEFTPRGKIIPGHTLLITITIYYPFHWFKGHFPDEAVRPNCEVTIQFYDDQTLDDVRQAFRCANIDTEISGDVSDDPYKPFEFMGNDDLKHALFYINNNIYIDSEPDGITKKQSETMKKWAQDNGYTLGDVLSLNTKLIDLEVRLGEPYIFQHLARCEHLLIFNEISFAHSNSSLGCKNYPKVLSTTSGRLKYCIFCNKEISSLIVVSEDDRMPLSANHLCERCFLSYNYNHIGEKIGLFRAYRCFKWKN